MYLGLRNLGLSGAIGTQGQTDLQRILALSPSLLIWPEQGAGWQGTSGGTLAASGQPLGLGADLSQLGGKTLAEWLAAPTTAELVTNGAAGFSGTTDWTAISSTISESSGRLSIAGIGAQDPGAASALGGYEAGKTFLIQGTIHSAGGSPANFNYVRLANGTGSFAGAVGWQGPSTYTGPIEAVVSVPAGWTGMRITVQRGGNPVPAETTIVLSSISVRELPGNHLRAGTWASPSDAARGTLQSSGGVTWIAPSGVDDQYSFLTALSARAIVARVRVPTGYTANDRFLVNDAETVAVSVNSGDWTNTGSGTTRINGASGAAFTEDEWQTLTIEWGSAQAFSRMWYSATGSQFGSMDVAALMVLNSPFANTADRALAESIIGATA
jgi:hypothetical protein